MADILGSYEGVGNSNIEERYHSKFPKAEQPQVRQMNAEEIAKYGPPTMTITSRVRGFEQLNASKGRGKKSKQKG